MSHISKEELFELVRQKPEHRAEPVAITFKEECGHIKTVEFEYRGGWIVIDVDADDKVTCIEII